MNTVMFFVILQVILSVFSPIQYKESISTKLEKKTIAAHLIFLENYWCEIDYEIIPGKENYLDHIKREHSFLIDGFQLLDEKQKEIYFNQHRIDQ